MPTHRLPSKRGRLEAFFKPIPKDGTEIGAQNIELDEVIVDRVEPEELHNQITEIEGGRPQGMVINQLERDPGLRIPIMQHPVNKRDEVRRAYLLLGPYQPKLRYPLSKFGMQNRGFNYSWFVNHPWLEYSPSKDAAYCFHCFLFETNPPKNPTFTSEGYRRWSSVNSGNDCPFLKHSGNVNSNHSIAKGNSYDLKNSAQQISVLIDRQSKEDVRRNRLRLKTTIECLLWLAFQQCAFRGHDESKGSKNRGNFIELIKYSATLNEDVNAVVLDNAPGNASYISPLIQKQILNIISNRVRSKIREDIGNAKYCILVDDSRDISKKEQMVIVLRYVDIDGYVQERFFDIQRVDDTRASTLKEGITKILNHYDLQIENMRGQGYDGASNMRGQWNGLQALFLKECEYAYFVHCFAHRLQLALVKTAENLGPIWKFYSMLTSIVNLVTASTHRFGDFQSAQEDEIAKGLDSGELETGKGANQIGTLRRAGSTRCSSHYGSVCSLLDKFEATCTTIKHIGESDPNEVSKVGEAQSISEEIRSFRFVFVLHLMFEIMGITEILCQALQKKTQDIVNAMSLVSTTKTLLRELRDEGWQHFIETVVLFCVEHKVNIPEFEARHMDGTGRSCQQRDNITEDHRYRVDIFNETINFQLAELDRRFPESTIELLILSSSLDPRDSFKSFNIDNIHSLAENFYPSDFNTQEVHILRNELHHYAHDVVNNVAFQNLATISELCRKLVVTKKAEVYPMIDRLIRIVLTLPVSTATAERYFSTMKLVKTATRNKMEEDFLRDCMMIYIEQVIAGSISIDSIIDEFHYLCNRRVHLMY